MNDVAGNHARSYFEMAPASIVVRLSRQLVAGYETYGFRTDGTFPEVVDGIMHEEPEARADGDQMIEKPNGGQEPKMKPVPDYPGKEFYLGGRIVKEMTIDVADRLARQEVTLDRDPRRLLDTVADKFLGG